MLKAITIIKYNPKHKNLQKIREVINLIIQVENDDKKIEVANRKLF